MTYGIIVLRGRQKVIGKPFTRFEKMKVSEGLRREFS